MRLGRLALARGQLDRVAHRRQDTPWLKAAWADPRTRVLVVESGQSLVRFGAGHGTPADRAQADRAQADRAQADGAQADAQADGAPGDGVPADGASAGLVLLPTAQVPEGDRILLGTDAAGVAYFAVLGPLPAAGPKRAGLKQAGLKQAELKRAGLREVGALLNDRDAGLLTHAVALANWHVTHTHCPRCGARTRLASAGHTRVCPVDDSEHFPRVDPAVIMLVLDSGGRCLLARNQKWPAKRVSILAGFVEPGESVEQAVAREVREEVGISVGEVRYLGSQPWPLPQSLMLGFSARAVEDGQGAQPIRVDDDEIAEAHWYGREDLRVAIESGAILLPPPVSIAHRIIEAWYGAPLPGRW